MYRFRPRPSGNTFANPCPAGWVLAFTLLAVFSGSAHALPVDGRVEVRGTHQNGGAGSTAYETTSLWENYSLSRRVPFHRKLVLQLDFVTRRQNLDSRTSGNSFDSEIVSLLPNASLTFRSDQWRAGLNARGIRKDQFGSGLPNQRDEHADFNGWLRTRRSWYELDLAAQQAASYRESALEQRDNREEQQSVGIRLMPTLADEVRYKFTRNQQHLRTFDTRLTYLSHQIQYRGYHEFDDRRGRVTLDARNSWLHQENQYGSAASLEYLPPVSLEYSLDDTPEQRDPLEPEPIPAPALIDLDRDTPGMVNIGDNASVVRTYGGDYRNFIMDFGEAETVDEVVLYVDTIVSFPDLMQWRAFTSDDPDAQDWSDELSLSEFDAVWFEDPDNRQGWRFLLTTPRTARRLKLVNTKMGPTEPDIFVTEVEAYQGLGGQDRITEQKVRRHRIQGDISYKLRPNLEFQYGGTHIGRYYDSEDRDVEGISHRFGAVWSLGRWRLAANHDVNQMENSTGQDTDANNQRLNLSTRTSNSFRMRVGWSRNEDRSWTQSHTTHNVSGNCNWRLAPDLTLIQNVGWGTRETPELDGRSQSWVTSTTLRGRPRPSLELELRRSDRWVSREAGADFSTFNTTELQSTWAIRPLLSLTSQVLYQRRSTDDVMVRNSLIWMPLPGGSVSLRLSASDQQDTRTEWFQRGAGALLTWRPRPRLFLEGGIEYVLVKQYDERNTPTNLQFRGSYSF